MNLAIFDFDLTITRKDSLIDFIYHTQGPLKSTLGVLSLSPLLLLHSLGIKGSDETKEKVLSWFFKNIERIKLEDLAVKYANEHLPAIIKEKAMQKIRWHQSQGDKIVIVSASLDIYLIVFCGQINAELLATGLDFKEGRFTGKLEGPNCKGPEKIRRLQAHYDLKSFGYIYAYGDSPSDLYLKNIANEFHYRSFV